jgi:hypothetical protein
MSLESDLIDFAIDQYKVCGEYYVVDCLAIWEREYGPKVSNKVRSIVEGKLKVKFKAKPIIKWG